MSRPRIRLGLLPAVLFFTFQGAPAPARAPAPVGVTPVALPGGGVADPAGKVGFVPNPGGGIDALDLATGHLLWDTREAPRPLLATADRLFTQAPAGRAAYQVWVVVLDTTRKGKRVLRSRPVAFPA